MQAALKELVNDAVCSIPDDVLQEVMTGAGASGRHVLPGLHGCCVGMKLMVQHVFMCLPMPPRLKLPWWAVEPAHSAYSIIVHRGAWTCTP